MGPRNLHLKKKYFPLYLITLLVSLIVAGQYYFNVLDISADPSKEEKKLYGHYESAFSKLAFNSIEKKLYKLSQVKAPVVILNFWASWCTPCLEEFPSIVKMKKKYSDEKVMIFGINSDEEDQMKSIKKTIEKYKLNFPIISEDSQKIVEKFMISAIPVSIIFHKGKVVEVTNGAKDFASSETYEFFDELLVK